MQNVRRYVDVKLEWKPERIRKLTANPLMQDFRIFNENLVGIQMQREEVNLNMPIYVGFSVLELSKLHMYKFHYEYMKPKYGDKAQLLFTVSQGDVLQ